MNFCHIWNEYSTQALLQSFQIQELSDLKASLVLCILGSNNFKKYWQVLQAWHPVNLT